MKCRDGRMRARRSEPGVRARPSGGGLRIISSIRSRARCSPRSCTTSSCRMRQRPRRLYLIVADQARGAADLIDHSGVFQRLRGCRWSSARQRCGLLSPYRRRALPLAGLSGEPAPHPSLHAELLLQARRRRGVLEEWWMGGSGNVLTPLCSLYWFQFVLLLSTNSVTPTPLPPSPTRGRGAMSPFVFFADHRGSVRPPAPPRPSVLRTRSPDPARSPACDRRCRQPTSSSDDVDQGDRPRSQPHHP